MEGVARGKQAGEPFGLAVEEDVAAGLALVRAAFLRVFGLKEVEG